MPTGTFRGRLARRSTLVVVLALGLGVVAPANAVDPVATRSGHEIFGPTTTRGAKTPTRSAAFAIQSGFQDSTIFSNLDAPTNIQFAADGRVVVAEKGGKIKIFNSVTDPNPTVFADLTTNVHNFWDRGLLGIALDPNFVSNHNIYALYTYNHILGDSAAPPRWPPRDAFGNDDCPTPPGPTNDGCVVSARLSRLTGNSSGVWDGNEHVLIEDWCQQWPSHGIGTVLFGPDGQLYAGAGDGASFNFADYGQVNNTTIVTPANPCGDPPSPVRTELAPPTAEGGALRAQDLFTPADPTGLDGSLIRVNPATGAASAGNANIGSTDLNARRIIAYGLRNPFRFTFKPGTSQLWIGDVGWNTWEEIDRVDNPTSAVKNFGWPCYEGVSPTPAYQSLNLNLCTNLYNAGTAVDPFFTWNHADHVVAGDACPATGPIPGTVISALAFYPATAGMFPAKFAGALFFGDQARKCIWAMKADGSGVPDPNQIETFGSGLAGPVDIKIGPDNALYYVGYDDGTIHRVEFAAPIAAASANPPSGPIPLTVRFDASGSSDPKGGSLSYAWDLDGNGQFNDSTSVTPSFTYTTAGTHTARVKVTDSTGAWDIASVDVSAGNNAPVATILSPPSSLTWSVGQTIGFSGRATDAQDGTEPGSRLHWTLKILHCPSACHEHIVQSFTGTSGTFTAPDHEYPSSLVLQLIAIDSTGTSSAPVSVTIQPKTVNLTINSNPAGVTLSAGSQTATAPFTHTAIVGSAVAVIAPSSSGGQFFVGWSDGKPASHTFIAPASATTLTARYTPPTEFHPIDPVRIVDTRFNLGLVGKLTGNVARSFVVADAYGIPASAIAITANVTVVQPTKAGYVSLTRVPNNAPPTSTINFPAHDTRANGVTMTLADDGRLSAVYRAAGATTDLIVDVTGYFVPVTSEYEFNPVTPTRVLDTRSGTGGYSTPFLSGVARQLQVTGGSSPVPSGAVAVTGNLTVTGQTAGGYVSMTTQLNNNPSVSTLNAPLGDNRANGLTIKLDTSGKVSLVYRGGPPGSNTAHLLFDVTGYYASGNGGMQFYPIQPTRSVDTRFGLGGGALVAGTTRALAIAGPDPIPPDAAAIAGNATIVGQTAAGWLAVTDTPTSSPTTSTINFPLGDTRANNLTVALSGGKVSAIYMGASGKTTHLIIDVSGYFK